jgi:hypothetical protein
MPRISSFGKIATVLLAFVLISLLAAPLGVVAHHNNEAEHAVKANDGVYLVLTYSSSPIMRIV